MPKYLLAYYGGSMPETPEEQQTVMDAWGAWMGQVGDAMADPGNPVGQAKTIASDGSVSAGGAANAVTGYTLLSAADMDAAVELAKGCPVLVGGGSIEVCETFDVM